MVEDVFGTSRISDPASVWHESVFVSRCVASSRNCYDVDSGLTNERDDDGGNRVRPVRRSELHRVSAPQVAGGPKKIGRLEVGRPVIVGASRRPSSPDQTGAKPQQNTRGSQESSPTLSPPSTPRSDSPVASTSLTRDQPKHQPRNRSLELLVCSCSFDFRRVGEVVMG